MQIETSSWGLVLCVELVTETNGMLSCIKGICGRQVCTDGLACKRRVCFFAHHEGELRKVQEEGAPSAGRDVDVLAGARLRLLRCRSRCRRCRAYAAQRAARACDIWRLCQDAGVAGTRQPVLQKVGNRSFD